MLLLSNGKGIKGSEHFWSCCGKKFNHFLVTGSIPSFWSIFMNASEGAPNTEATCRLIFLLESMGMLVCLVRANSFKDSKGKTRFFKGSEVFDSPIWDMLFIDTNRVCVVERSPCVMVERSPSSVSHPLLSLITHQSSLITHHMTDDCVNE
ncbi:hypothetical protein FisN_11Lu267 [Fistulifera solaris]|uniref:Uncharacterized protein n=1 Tax=Fistulifera solaris TaxID=1519565 RepID=A0A1Z5J6Y1_FISSO|nr:hypothetical protein FisN_11Lu267 [Fistulifera solaris]|eukprot:GAX09764.1 hypothetical protein FisN_11Lu267 [Fistulifera solaris]